MQKSSKLLSLLLTVIMVVGILPMSVFAAEDTYYKINLIQSEHGTLTVDRSTAHTGENVTVYATPELGYKCKSYSIVSGTARIEQAHPEEAWIKIGTSDITVTAVFEKAYQVTLSTNIDTNYTSISSATNWFLPGEYVAFSTLINSGSCGFSRWEVVHGGDNSLLIDESNSLTAITSMPANDIEVRAYYYERIKARVFTIGIDYGEAIFFEGQTEDEPVPGKLGRVNANPKDGYYLSSWDVFKRFTKDTYDLKLTRRGRNFWNYTVPHDSIDFYATFEPIPQGAGPYSVTLTQGEGYVLTPNSYYDFTDIVYDRNVEFSITLLDGYYKTDDFAVLANGEEVDSPYGVDYFNLCGIRENQTVTVRGVERPYNISLPNDLVWLCPIGGSSSPVRAGGSFSFSLGVSSDCELGEDFAVKANGTVLVGENDIYTVTNIHEDIEITVEGVTKKPGALTILESEGGIASARNRDPQPGDTITIIVNPFDDYEFSHFDVPTRNVEITKTDDGYSFEMPRDSVVLQPIFKKHTLLVKESIIQELSDNNGYIIDINNVNFDLSKEVVNSLKEKGGDLEIKVQVSDDELLTDAQKEAIPVEYKNDDVIVVNVTASVGDEELHELGGLVTLTIPYDTASIPAGQKVAVYYIPENGTAEIITDVEVGDGYVRFTTNHFSSFALGLVEDDIFTSINISLDSDINVYFYAKANDTTVARFTMNGKTVTVDGELQQDGEYKYEFTGVAPQFIGDTITAELVDGETVIASKDYSVLQYLNKLKVKYPEAENPELHQLINDLLVYGGAAQVFTGHNTGELVSNGVTGSVFEPITKDDLDLQNKEKNATFTSAAVNFNNINRMKIYFTAEDTEGLTIKYKIGESEEQEIEYVSDGNRYVITTPGISASDFTNVFTFIAYKNDVAGATLTYSVKSYVYAKQNSANEVMANLAKATYNYGKAAKAFVEAN